MPFVQVAETIVYKIFFSNQALDSFIKEKLCFFISFYFFYSISICFRVHTHTYTHTHTHTHRKQMHPLRG